LMLTLILLVGLSAIIIQLIRGHTPIQPGPYLSIYSTILLPNTIFLAGICTFANTLLRNKYLAYVVSIGTAAGLYYFYTLGYNQWLYNPLLYHLWTYADLTGVGNNQTTIILHRIYCIAIATSCLSFAHFVFERKVSKGFLINRRLTSKVWSILIGSVALAIAIVTGLRLPS